MNNRLPTLTLVLSLLFVTLLAACAPGTSPTGAADPQATTVPVAPEPTHMVAPNLAPPVTVIQVGPITGSAGNRKDVVCIEPLLAPSGRPYTGAVVVDITLDEHYGSLFGLPTGTHVLSSGMLLRQQQHTVADGLETSVYAMTDTVCGANYIASRMQQESDAVAVPWVSITTPVKTGEAPLIQFTFGD